MKKIGQILKNRRNQLGYTQEFAAEKVGISYSYYTKVERGEQLPSLEICVHLADTFHLSLDEWILGTQPQPLSSPEALDLVQYLTQLDSSSIQDIKVLLQKAALFVHSAQANTGEQ